jgi:hypothetical protein
MFVTDLAEVSRPHPGVLCRRILFLKISLLLKIQPLSSARIIGFLQLILLLIIGRDRAINISQRMTYINTIRQLKKKLFLAAFSNSLLRICNFPYIGGLRLH